MEHTTHHHSEHHSEASEVLPHRKNNNQQYGLPAAILVGAILIAGSIFYNTKLLLTKGSSFNAGNTLAGNIATSPAAPGSGQPQAGQPDFGSSKVSIDDDPVLGKKDAPITVIEFSDFQCPFCRRFWKDTLPQIQKEYIDTGKVKFVYRDYPLNFHPMAQKYGEAGECADDQGKFIAMHDKIFVEQDKKGQGTISDITADNVKQWAGEIGLNSSKFNECLDSGKYAQEVQKDFADGSAAGVSGTPTVFIGKSNSSGTIDGTKVVGAQPYAAFKIVIDQQLGK